MPFLLPAAAAAVKVGASAAVAGASTAAVAGATVAAKVGIMATLKAVAFNALTSAAISAAMSALQPQVGTAGRTFEWTLDPNAPIPFAAGRVGVAGTVCHLETYGPDKMYYGFVSVLSGAGPIRAVTGFKGDDESVAFDANGKAISSQWANEMWFRSRLGTQPDTALTNPPGLKNNAQLPGWTAAHKLSGKACYMLVLGENSKRTAYPTGEPKPLVTVEGLFGWDPRQDSTWPGGVGPCRLNDPSTWVWLDNPILWGLKWALGLWEGPLGKGAPGVDYQVGGIGAKVEGIRVDRFVAAANVADANGWKVAAYPTTDDDKSQVLDAFLQAGGAMYALEQGKISCIQRAAPRASVATITAEDTAGPLAIDTAASRIDRINTIRPRFWSEAHRWQLTAIDDVTAQAYRDEDGAVRPRGIDFPYVPLATQAGQLAALQIANTREPIAGTIPLKPHMRNVAPGTAFTISEPGFLLDGLKCLCLNTDYDPAAGVVTVTFVSETDAKYPFALGQSPNPPAPPVLVAPDRTVSQPEPWEWVVQVPENPAGTPSQPSLVLTGEVGNATASGVLVELGPAEAGPWTMAYEGPPTAERIPLTGIQPGQTYYVAVSYRRGNNYSARTIYGPYTAPALVASDTVNIGDRPVVDVLAMVDATKQKADDLETVYGDTASAAQSAADAAAASAAAVLAKADAVQAKDESITAAGASAASAAQAGGYRTDAETAAAASSADRIAAEAARDDTVVAGGDPDFLDGLTAWGPEGTADPGQYSPANVPGWAASYQGRPGVALADTGARRQFYSRKLWPVDTSRKYKVRTRLHAGATGSGLTYVGFRALDAAGANTAGNGSHQYAAVGGEALAAGWHERASAVITGEGGINGVSQFNPGTRQIQLMAYLNYDNEAGKVAALDGIWLEDVTESEAARLSAEASVQSASTATAKATEAAASAEAAEQDRLAAQTARSGSEAARDTAVTAKEDAQGAAATAAAQQALATTAKNDAQAAASASAGSASLASSKADEAGTHAAAASAERVAAEAARGDADDAAAAAATQAATATAKAGEAGDHAASALAQATTAATKAGEALTYAGQSSDARDDAVTARNLSQTAASNAAAAAATAQAAESTATDKAAQASASATVAANLTGATANLLKRSQLFTTADTDDWSKGNSGLPSPTFAVDTHLNQRPPGELSYFMYSDGGGVNYMETRLPYFLAEPGKRYGAAVYAVATDGDGGAFIYWQDKDGNYVSYSPAATVAYGEATLSPDLATWKRLVTFGVCPPGAVRGVVTLRKNISPGPAGVWFCRPMAFQATDTQTQAPPWAPANTSEAASQIPGLQASVSTAAAAAIDAQGKVDAKYGVTLDGNGYASGFENTNDGTVAEFNILADKFGIRDPSGSAERTEYRGGNWYVYSTGIRTRYGKAFGGTEKIVWWTGPDSIAEGSETKANAYVYISQNTVNGPRFGGSDVPAAGGGGGGSGAKQLAGASGNLGATATISSVAAGSLVEIGAFFDVAALDAPDATMTGYIRFEESTDGVNWTTLTDVNVFVTSDSLVLPGPSYAATGADASCSVFGTKSGTVTYRARFVRTAGANIYGSDYSMSGTLKVTAPAA